MQLQERVEKEIDRFIDEVVRISSAHRLYLRFWDQRKEDVDVLNQANAFFNSVFQALESDIIISLSKLFEGGRSDRNLLKLVSYVKHHHKSIDWGYKPVKLIEIEQHEQLIEEQSKVIDHVTSRRDKFYAHHDKEYFLDADKLLQDFPLDTDAVEALLDVAMDIVRDYYLALTGVNMDMTGSLDVGRVFRALDEYYG